jgi:hypothetical protein
LWHRASASALHAHTPTPTPPPLPRYMGATAFAYINSVLFLLFTVALLVFQSAVTEELGLPSGDAGNSAWLQCLAHGAGCASPLAAGTPVRPPGMCAPLPHAALKGQPPAMRAATHRGAAHARCCHTRAPAFTRSSAAGAGADSARADVGAARLPDHGAGPRLQGSHAAPGVAVAAAAYEHGAGQHDRPGPERRQHGQPTVQPAPRRGIPPVPCVTIRWRDRARPRRSPFELDRRRGHVTW